MRTRRGLLCLLGTPALLLVASIASHAADMTKLDLLIKTPCGKPVDRASVIVKFVEGRSVVKLGKQIRTTWELKTNQEGEAKIPEIPRAKSASR